MNTRGNRTAAYLFLVLLFVIVQLSPTQSGAQDEAQPPKIDYTSVIKPIVDARCATCHNENDEEGGLNLNDQEMFLEYVTKEKPLESALYQSLTGSNDLSQMPPEEDNDGNALDPCTPQEMALIYLWIQQGASFEGAPVEEKQAEDQKSAVHRMFLFSGYFHPAIVHFPIALITISAFFIIFFFRNESLSDDAAFYLLLFGTLSSIVACVVGWAFADRNPVAVSDFSLGINRHRWFGIGATGLAAVSTFLGWKARNEVLANRSGMWKFGVILTAALMGIVGHQGGEEVYGEGVYERAAQKLIPEYWPFAKEDDSNTEPGKGDDESTDPNNDSTPETAGVEDDKNSSSDAESNSQNEPNDGDNDSKTDESGSPPSDPTINSDDNK